MQNLPTPDTPFAVQTTHDSITVTWPSLKRGGEQMQYEVCYREAQNHEDEVKRSTVTTNSEVLRGLQAGMKYEVCVRGIFSGKSGPFSEMVTLCTDSISAPPAPSFHALSNTLVRVTINPPQMLGNHARIDAYTLLCFDMTNRQKLYSCHPTTTQQLELDVEIEAGKQYAFRVRVHFRDEKVDGELSATLDSGSVPQMGGASLADPFSNIRRPKTATDLPVRSANDPFSVKNIRESLAANSMNSSDANEPFSGSKQKTYQANRPSQMHGLPQRTPGHPNSVASIRQSWNTDNSNSFGDPSSKPRVYGMNRPPPVHGVPIRSPNDPESVSGIRGAIGPSISNTFQRSPPGNTSHEFGIYESLDDENPQERPGLPRKAPRAGANPAAGQIDEAARSQSRKKKRVKQDILYQSKRVGGTSSVAIHQLPLKHVYGSKKDMLFKYEVGDPRPGSTEKVMMVVGATGSGKTTLINAMVNYIFNIEYEDKYRFRLIMEDQSAANQAQSQTQNITAYTLHQKDAAKIDYTLTVIDTPGFGDTSGIHRDMLIEKQIKDFFSTKGKGGIDHIDAIGFVVQAALPRLTPAQKYVFDAILSLFGKDIMDNIFLMITFADAKKPPVLAGVKEANVTYKKFFKFNNSAMFPEDDEDDEDADADHFNQMFWSMGFTSFEKFLSELLKVPARSLLLTKAVLDERNRLELYVTKIHDDIKRGLNQLEQLRIESQVLMDFAAEIDRSKDFTYTVIEDKMVKQDIPVGQHTTNCLTCNYTCHENCVYADDDEKKDCIAMDEDGNCTMCPGNCNWQLHKNTPYIIVLEQHSVDKTANDLKAKYEDACGNRMNAEQLVQAVMEEFEATQNEVLEATEKVRSCLKRLNEIALKPNPLSCLDYIDLLIKSEESEAKPGWQDRINQLMGVRQKAEYLRRVDEQEGNFNPFDDHTSSTANDMDDIMKKFGKPSK